MRAKSKALVSLPVIFGLFLWALLPSMNVFGTQEIKGGFKERCGEQVDGSHVEEKPYISFPGGLNLYCIAKTMEKLGKKETNNEVNNTKIASKNCIQGFGNVFGVIPDNK